MSDIQVLEIVASSRGGGAVHVRHLALGLDRQRFTAAVIMPQDGGNVTRNDFAQAGIPFYPVDIAAGLSLQALREVRRLSANVDIVHVHGSRSALFGRLAALTLGSRRPGLVYSIHGFAAPHYAAPRRQVLLLLERLLVPVTDRWICVSQAEKNALIAARLARPEHVTMIWNGIDSSVFHRTDQQRRAARTTLDLPQDAIVLTTVCRLYRPRDFPTLLKAFGQVCDAIPSARLLIVGDGPLRPEVEQGIASLGLQRQVGLLGMRPDVPQILSATDVFVLASRSWEGLPLAVLEAMASSLAVVASDVGGTREALVDGQTGYLFPPGDVAALAQRLEQLARQPQLREMLGSRGRDRALHEFGLQRMVCETAAVYLDLQSAERAHAAPTLDNHAPERPIAQE